MNSTFKNKFILKVLIPFKFKNFQFHYHFSINCLQGRTQGGRGEIPPPPPKGKKKRKKGEKEGNK